MITALIILGILTVFVIGFVQVKNRHSRVVKNIDFAAEYRTKFVDFANKFLQTYNSYNNTGNLDGELYIWLTMNVNKIQNDVGSLGVMSYKPAYQNYIINNYPIIINTIPKFRDGQVEKFDVGSVDDCLLRYIGYMEDFRIDANKNLSNPIIWFREGIKEILSLPMIIFNWFGIISIRTVNSIKDSFIYKIISGLIALVTLISGLVTIVVGYEQTLQIAKNILKIS